jgi:hypothetical protein
MEARRRKITEDQKKWSGQVDEQIQVIRRSD